MLSRIKRGGRMNGGDGDELETENQFTKKTRLILLPGESLS